MRRALVVVSVLAALGTTGCKKKLNAENVELDETFRTLGGFAVIHHPRAMRAKQASEHVTTLRPAPSSPFEPTDELFLVVNPSTTPSVDEYVALIHKEDATLPAWTEIGRRPSTCMKTHEGVELTATFKGDDGRPRHFWSCAFVVNRRGFRVSYSVAEPAADTDAPVLRKIADAIEVSVL